MMAHSENEPIKIVYNVILTPHTAWQGHWTHIHDSLEIWNNVLRVLRDEPVQHLVK